MKKQTFILPILVLGMSVSAWAQGPRGEFGKRGPRGPMPDEVKSYIQENILPTVESQRAKLDAHLSDQELAEIIDIKEGLLQLKEDKQALRTSLKEIRESYEGEGRPEIPEELKESMRAHRKTQRQLMTQAWAIVDANEAEIETLLEGLEPQAEQWHEDLRGLMETHRPEGAKSGRKGERNGPREGVSHRPGRGGKEGVGRAHGPRMGRGGPGLGGPIGKWHHPVAFLLFDASFMEDKVEETRFNVFPNPSSLQNTLEYTVKLAGDVQIDLLDKNGNTLKRLLSTPKEAGSYTLSVDLADLGPGVYLYQIKTASGTQTQKVLVKK